jgi:uncharacterized protein
VRHSCKALGIPRRGFLEGVLAAAASPALLGGCGAQEGARWVSSAIDGAGDAGLAWSDPDTDARFVPTGFRGHDVAVHPLRPWEVALFGRRPGQTGAIVDLAQGQVLTTFEASTDHGFQGHGFYTHDGAYLVTTEADLVTGEGWLGLRETDGYRLVGTRPTFGIGPHEALLLPDGDTVAVANGGLLTRPATGREVLNLHTMDSTLAYVSLETGELLEERRVPVPKGSVRHLDAAPEGWVAFGLQVQREAVGHDRVLPLGGLHRRGAEPILFGGPAEATAAMDDYVGSVAVCASLGVIGMTSPRGDVATFWEPETGEALAVHALVDCAGLAAEETRFVLSSSVGEVRTLDATDLGELRHLRRRFDDVRWDNHLITIPLETGP